MARLQAIAQTTEVTLSGTVARTVLQLLAPSNHRVTVLRWGVFFDSTSVSAEPVEVTLIRQTSAGVMSALTPAKLDDSLAETLQTSAQYAAITEPSNGDVIDVVEVHPQTGYEIIYPLGQEPVIGGGDRLGIICTAPADVNVRAKIAFEE